MKLFIHSGKRIARYPRDENLSIAGAALAAYWGKKDTNVNMNLAKKRGVCSLKLNIFIIMLENRS